MKKNTTDGRNVAGSPRSHTAALRPRAAKSAHGSPLNQKAQRKAAFIHWLNRYGLSRRKLRRNRVFAYFGDHLFSKDLWSFRPESLARGWLIGVLSASTPFLGAQIVMALPFNILFRANIPVTLGLILLTNPATAVPYYGFAYWLGCKILGNPIKGEGEALALTEKDTTSLVASMHEKGVIPFLTEILSGVFLNLMVGCLSIGLVVGLLGYFGIRWFVKHPPSTFIKK